MKVSLEIGSLINNEQCYEQVRRLRWLKKITCPHCQSEAVIKRGKDDRAPSPTLRMSRCHKRFDDLTNTVFSGHHQPLKIWVLCLYLMGLNLSNRQISQELNLNKDDTQRMCLSASLWNRKKKPVVIKLTKNGVPQVGGELANPNGIDDVGVRKLTTNLEQAGSLA